MPPGTVVYVNEGAPGYCDAEGGFIIGCCHPGVNGPEVSVSEWGLANLDPTRILIHEFGHALGLEHKVGTVMDPFYQNMPTFIPDYTTWVSVYHNDSNKDRHLGTDSGSEP